MVCKNRTATGGTGPQDSASHQLQIPISEIHRYVVDRQEGRDRAATWCQARSILQCPGGERGDGEGRGAQPGRRNDQELEWAAFGQETTVG